MADSRDLIFQSSFLTACFFFYETKNEFLRISTEPKMIKDIHFCESLNIYHAVFYIGHII